MKSENSYIFFSFFISIIISCPGHLFPMALKTQSEGKKKGSQHKDLDSQPDK